MNDCLKKKRNGWQGVRDNVWGLKPGDESLNLTRCQRVCGGQGCNLNGGVKGTFLLFFSFLNFLVFAMVSTTSHFDGVMLSMI